jgi:16S rRNA (adenine1518-N6/adenine1519-N6)-dimethyltransferase
MPRYDKSLGQHHLIGGHLCRPLLDFLLPPSEPTDRAPGSDLVLEIGPGGGVLTGELLAAGYRVVAWELDQAWAFELCRRYPSPRLTVVVGDAIDIPWERLPRGSQMAGNLPYQVATVLVRQVLGYPERIPRAAVLVQKEVGERLVAKPGDKPYGALSVHAASSARVRWLGRVKKGSFFPPPKVDGAFVGFELQPPPLPPEEMEEFRRTVNLAFGQRRKTLRNSLGAGWGKDVAASALARAGLDGGRRAEELGLEDFLRLTAAVREQSA